MVSQEVLQALVLGILQGLTEFLPISSSAHLILLPWFLDWVPFGILFDVLLHGGTLLAILLYFRADWMQMVSNLGGLLRSREWRAPQHRLLGAIVTGTLPAIFVALLFRSFIEDHLRSPLVTVFTLAGFGILLWLADHFARHDRPLHNIGLREGLLVGFAQAMALIPGVSRSGVTITAGLLLGLSRADAARFSFLLSAPILVLATLKGISELLATDEHTSLVVALAGMVSAFLVGFFCIKYFLQYLRGHTYLAFILYRILLACCILVIWYRSEA
jgi:undecaprenyl-diphosphatase